MTNTGAAKEASVRIESIHQRKENLFILRFIGMKRALGTAYTVVPTLSMAKTFQDPLQRMPETADSNKPHIYYVFSYTNIPVIKFNL